MPVDALPPPPPVMVTPDTLALTQSSQTRRFDGYAVHLIGEFPVSENELNRVFEKAWNVDVLVAALGEIAHMRTSELGRIHIAILPGNMFLMWGPAVIGSVESSNGVGRFFSSFANTHSPSIRQIERRRILSSVYADRARVHVSPQFRNAEDGTLILRTVGHSTGRLPLYATVGYTNAGNRFVGEHLFDLRAGVRTKHGADWSFTAKTATGSESEQADFKEGVLGYSRVTLLGFLEGGMRALSYTTDVNGVDVSGDLQQVRASWAQILSARRRGRSLISFGALWSQERFEVQSLVPANERFLAAELTLRNFQHLSDGRWRFNTVGNVSYPLTESGNTVANELDWYAVGWDADLRYQPSWRASLHFSGQYASATVVNAQQWSLGGPARMAAFRTGALLGDQGYHAQARLTSPSLQLGTSKTAISLFGERGYAEFRGAGEHLRPLNDVGAELATNWPGGSVFKVMSALPVGARPDDIDEVNVYFVVRISFN